jgi:diguanylate cyclase (GGDEF)-like protein
MSEVLSDILPQEQDLRAGGRLMAGGTALLACLALLVCAFLNLLPWDVALAGTAGVVTLVAAFSLMFRSGVNRRFRDPSLATEQTAAAILFLAYVMYYAGPAREALTLFYLLIMLFGALRLSAARLAVLSALALIAHGAMLHLTWLREQEFMDLEAAVTEFAVLMVALPWFAAMGGYVNRLRARLAASNRQLEAALGRIREIATRDELTGAYNRRYLVETLAREHARAARLGGRVALCMIDVDHFKQLNDRLGHAAGDRTLKQVAASAARCLRGADVFGRFGGEEFLAVLPDTDREGALQVAERVRAAVQSEAGVTVTIGVAQAAGEDVNGLLAKADQALYRGKAAGRNRVV